MNRAIEIHDSKISAVTPNGTDVAVRFAAAYIHASDGRPGVDSGSGWIQELDLVFSDADLVSRIRDLPQELDDGTLWLGNLIHRNLIPLPLEYRGDVCFSAVGLHGDSLVLYAAGVRVVSVGEPKYVELFIGMGQT